MRLAFDCTVPKRTIKAAEENGFEVVYYAAAEHDEWWFREAMELGADVFVSADWDLAVLSNKYDRGFIKLPQGLKGAQLVSYIIARARQANKAFRSLGRYPEILK